MATGGLTESVLGASDELFDLQCEICRKIGKQREARHFCENCNSCMCDTCKSAHNRIPDLSQHKMSTVQNECGLCLKEGNKTQANHFCKTCNSYICSLCLNTHKSFDALQHHIIVSGESMLRRCDPSASDDVSNKFRHLSTNEMSKCPTDTSTVPSTNTYSEPSTNTSTEPSTNTSTEPSTNTSTGPSDDTSFQRQTKPLADMTIQTSNKINIKLENDKETPWITGCCFMPEGELVLCDCSNDTIKLLDRSLTIQDSVALQDKPSNVADLDGSNIAVTLPGRKQVQLIQLLPTVKIGRTISVEMVCHSIAVAGGQIYVYGGEDSVSGKVKVYDMGWNLKGKFGVSGLVERIKSKLGIGSHFWGYIAISQATGRVFVSTTFTNTITCLSSDIKLVWRYKDDTLGFPRGLYVDSHDKIIVCNRWNHSIDILSAEGKRYKTPTLLSSSDGIKMPCSVTFRPDDQTLVVGCFETDVIYVYKLS